MARHFAPLRRESTGRPHRFCLRRVTAKLFVTGYNVVIWTARRVHFLSSFSLQNNLTLISPMSLFRVFRLAFMLRVVLINRIQVLNVALVQV